MTRKPPFRDYGFSWKALSACKASRKRYAFDLHFVLQYFRGRTLGRTMIATPQTSQQARRTAWRAGRLNVPPAPSR